MNVIYRWANPALILVALVPPLMWQGCNSSVSNLAQLTPTPASVPFMETVSLQILNYTPSPQNVFKDIYVSNFSMKPMDGKLYYSTSRDGLTDSLKAANSNSYNFNPSGPYYSLENFSDLFLYLAGITANQKNLLFCDINHQGNTAHDGFTYLDNRVSPAVNTFLGLRDCEKLYMGLDPASFDSIGNGVPDYMKMRCGLNPSNKNDAGLKISNDITAKEKCKKNLPIDESVDSKNNPLFAYNYQINSTPSNNTVLMNFNISNIAVYNGGLDNFIAIYIVENNNSNTNPTLSSAYIILPSNSSGKTYKVNYWWNNQSPTSGSTSRTNQEIFVQ